jgi:DNA-binding transcriptional ArsR family regulator
MITGPIVAEIAALLADPARATMVWALLDGGALTASELAVAARITPQTASTHLAKLTEAGLLSMARHGRHRYFRFASPRVTDMIDGIVAVALEKRPRYRPLSRQARALLDDEVAEITRAGTRFFTEFGIELPTPRSPRRHYGRLCLDWTERRPHLAGAVGAAVTKRYFDLGWLERMNHTTRSSSPRWDGEAS